MIDPKGVSLVTEACGSYPISLSTVTIPPRANVLGVGIHALDWENTLGLMESAIVEGRKGYICVTNVHVVIEARKDPRYRRVLNNSFLTLPDGRPTVWVGQIQGFKAMEQVNGPDLMLKFCEISCRKGYSHFFYGGQPGVAEQLKDFLTCKFPGLNVLGSYCPPFRPLALEEEEEVQRLFSRLKPDVTWIGLGAPKQELFMADHLESLDTKLMVGVGAAFDMHTGRLRDAPPWVKRAGLAWVNRLAQEPRRLWKRYLTTNSRFICEIILQLLNLKAYDLEASSDNQQHVPKDAALR